MDMGVDQAGHESGVAELDDFSALRMFHGGTDFGDAIVLDEDLTRGDEFASFNFEEASGVKDDSQLGHGLSRLRKPR